MKKDIERVLREAPGLKGRQIAKKLGLEKKDVNSFLAHQEHNFAKDENDCWSIVQPLELSVQFNPHSWIDADSFEDCLIETGSPLESECTQVVFVIPEKCRLLVEASCRLLALCNQLVDVGKKVTLDFTGYKQALSFLDRVGFFSVLSEKCEVLPKKPKVSRAQRYKGQNKKLVEFGVIEPTECKGKELTSEDKSMIDELTDAFVDQAGNEYETVASTIFGELIGNIKNHSSTKLKGLASLHKYEGSRPHIQTVVSDSGTGIAGTLKKGLEQHYPELYKKNNQDDYEAFLVQEAMTKGGISRHGKGRGAGFQSTSKQVIKFDAKLVVRQETFSLKIEYKNGDLVSVVPRMNLPRILGTHICFDFMLD
ncbi:MAG: ATP-binding protein [Gammaproteobacteria bacterium]|nr:MAG: ATP-binding protein [Gammaproteobacteria bacterium]RLA53741.1 MAG: ATP-binding protein [Gammaproteobacteria bacterium]